VRARGHRPATSLDDLPSASAWWAAPRFRNGARQEAQHQCTRPRTLRRRRLQKDFEILDLATVAIIKFPA
jgi:hypothetical protein